MLITETIDTKLHEAAWAARFDPDKTLLYNKELALSPAAQAQYIRKDPNNPASQEYPMPVFSELNSVMNAWEYTGWYDECLSWHKTCYIGDWTYLNKMMLTGPDVIACLESSTIANYRNFKIGRAKHIISIRPDGKLLGEGIAFRKAEDKVLCTGGRTCSAGIMLKTSGFNVKLEDMTAKSYIYHVQGSRSIFVLEEASGSSLRDVEFGTFKDVKIAGRTVEVFRSGMSLELGYELSGSAADGSVVWNAVVEAGAKYGLKQMGLRAMNTNHIEAFFPTQFVDYMPAFFPPEMEKFMAKKYFSPVDFGWTKVIDFERDFPGKEVLLDEIKKTKRKSVTLEWNNEDTVAIFASLFDKAEEPVEQLRMPNGVAETKRDLTFAYTVISPADEEIGLTMGRAYSPFFRKVLSTAVIKPEFAVPETEVCILYGKENGRKIKIRAVTKTPPYKQDNRRIDVTKL
jgi:glycine cleavage system aminomethyltransferase T